MASKKKSVLPSIEIIIVIIFFFSFIVWAVSKCNATKALYQDQATEATIEETTEESTESTSTPTVASNPTTTANPTPSTASVENALPSGTATSSPAVSTPIAPALTTSPSSGYATKLYVSIDGLNMRRGPSLDSAILLRMPLFEELTFMNEVTDSTQRISLGDEIANDPWVKVRHKKGQVGWVYGAGVHYYKRKRE